MHIVALRRWVRPAEDASLGVSTPERNTRGKVDRQSRCPIARLAILIDITSTRRRTITPIPISSTSHGRNPKAGNAALTPTTGGPAHKRAGLAIVYKGPHGLAARHARRLLVRVHQLHRGDHPRVLGHHRVPPVTRTPALGSQKKKRNARTRNRSPREHTPSPFRKFETLRTGNPPRRSDRGSTVDAILASSSLSLTRADFRAAPTSDSNSQACRPTVVSSTPPGWLNRLNAPDQAASAAQTSVSFSFVSSSPPVPLCAAPPWPQVRTQFSVGPRCCWGRARVPFGEKIVANLLTKRSRRLYLFLKIR